MKKKFVCLFFTLLVFLGISTQVASACTPQNNNKGNVGIDPGNLRPDQGQIILTKKDSKTGKGVNNAYYTIFYASGSVAYRMRTSNSNGTPEQAGKAYLSGYLNPGTYTVKETAAPAGYKLDTTVHKLTIPKSNSRLSVTYYDDPIVTTGALKIKKIDSNSGLPLAGADFSVTDSLGKKQTGTTNSDGILELTGLEAGTATITETKAPNGYAINNNIPSVTIKAEQQSSVTIKNQALKKLEVKTVDVDDNPISGIKVLITKDGYPSVGTTGKDGYYSTEFVPGTGTVEALSVPSGYTLISQEIVDFTITPNSNVTTITFKYFKNGM